MMTLDIQNDYLEFASILDDKYLLIDTIGFGRYAKVKLAIDVEDKQKYAIKIMITDPTTSQQKLQQFINEIQSQTEFEHRHIIRIVQCRINGVYKKVDGRILYVSYFVMELANQGELYELLEKTPQFSEKFARSIFVQLIKGIEHLHERGVVHRDIKAENILFSNGVLKLADFGFCAKTIDEKGSRVQFEVSQHLGSPEYNPPELSNVGKQKYYTPESADIFAAGVILFTMVMRSAPFKTSKNLDPYYSLLRQNKQQFWQIYGDIASTSAQFKDLVEKILDENPTKRITLEQLKQHPWMQGPILSQAEFQKELKNRSEIVLSKQIVKISNKRETKFANRKSVQKVETETKNESPPKYLQQSLEIVDTINAKLSIKPGSPKEQFKQEKLKVGMVQKQQNHKVQRTKEKRSSPGTPSNDSDN